MPMQVKRDASYVFRNTRTSTTRYEYVYCPKDCIAPTNAQIHSNVLIHRSFSLLELGTRLSAVFERTAAYRSVEKSSASAHYAS